jgi:hypothetical protein
MNSLNNFHFKEKNMPISIVINNINGLPIPVCDINGFLLKKIHSVVSQKIKGEKIITVPIIIDMGNNSFFINDKFI